jgi:predicted dithiol-disulfide oxidoreductase (DUF899 family)
MEVRIDTMNYRATSARLAEYRRLIAELREKMREAQTVSEPEEVPDYVFMNPEGSVRLSGFFGEKPDLIVIHNMGASCPHCTLWADGFNGIYDHLASRAAFILSSPDLPDIQKRFAAGRGWRFPMVSHHGTTFAADMGYCSKDDGWLPGVSVFRKEGNRILRVSDTGFNPGDDFCTLWHLLDLLPGGAGDWEAKFRYG